MKIILTPKEIVDKGGVNARMENEIKEGLYTQAEFNGHPKDIGFHDFGLVEVDGKLFYKSGRVV